MCGISGFANQDRKKEADPYLLRKMSAALRSRGPDADGFFFEKGVGLAHQRLSVIDLESGQQPMSAAAGQVWITFNGEIYNFQQLRSELCTLGAEFKTRSDTEVILQGYLKWGWDLLPKLAGMFAFALWDSRLESLFLVRDRLGVKPLYWTSLSNNSLVFGSELSALREHPEVSQRLNIDQALAFVGLGYVPGDESILAGVNRLPPGSLLTWKRGKETTILRWWDIVERWKRSESDPRPMNELEEEFGHLLRQAVTQRLIADVPVGSFLSGGLDSSVVTALIKETKPNLTTFSIGFKERSYSELPEARVMANFLKCNHQEEIVDGSDPNFLLEVMAKQDEPLGDTSVLPMYALCRMAKKQVTVALSGDGGDELLAGYTTQRANQLHTSVRHWPRPIFQMLQRTIGLLPDSRRKVNALFKAKKFLAGIDLPIQDAIGWWRMLLSGDQLTDLSVLRKGFNCEIPFLPFREEYQKTAGLDPLSRSLAVDYQIWLRCDILAKVDRASMNHGLEVRSPFLDHRLVEFCMRLPSDLKLRRGQGKWLLRKFAGDLVPSSVIKRKKSGFNAPVSHWLSNGWKEVASEVFKQDFGFLKSETIERLWKEHLLGTRDHGHLLFALLTLGLWLRKVRPTIG